MEQIMEDQAPDMVDYRNLKMKLEQFEHVVAELRAELKDERESNLILIGKVQELALLVTCGAVFNSDKPDDAA